MNFRNESIPKERDKKQTMKKCRHSVNNQYIETLYTIIKKKQKKNLTRRAQFSKFRICAIDWKYFAIQQFINLMS